MQISLQKRSGLIIHYSNRFVKSELLIYKKSNLAKISQKLAKIIKNDEKATFYPQQAC